MNKLRLAIATAGHIARGRDYLPIRSWRAWGAGNAARTPRDVGGAGSGDIGEPRAEAGLQL